MLLKKDNTYTSKLVDLTNAAELLENSIKRNDKYTVRRILDVNYSYFRIKTTNTSLINNEFNEAKKFGQNLTATSCNASLANLSNKLADNNMNTFLERVNGMEIPSVFFNILHLAIENNAADVLRICLKYGLNPNEPGTSSKNALFNSSNKYFHNSDCIKYPIKCKYCKKKSSIRTTATNNIKSLYSKFQEPPVEKERELSPEKACETRHLAPLSPNITNYNEINYSSYAYLVRLAPIFLAVSRCNHTAVELLLTYDACSNMQDDFGNTPLHLAVAKKPRPCRDCVYILLKHHATSHVYNNRLQTPLYVIELLTKKDDNDSHR